jgi:hypothetical protein
MVPAALSAREKRAGDWICLECEETLHLAEREHPFLDEYSRPLR